MRQIFDKLGTAKPLFRYTLWSLTFVELASVLTKLWDEIPLSMVRVAAEAFVE